MVRRSHEEKLQKEMLKGLRSRLSPHHRAPEVIAQVKQTGLKVFEEGQKGEKDRDRNCKGDRRVRHHPKETIP